jgi:hypothetical protein
MPAVRRMKVVKRFFRALGVGLKWLILALVCTYDMLAARLKDKPYLVDFRNVRCSRTIPVYESDGVHLKPPGNRMVAIRLAEMLKERGWLKNSVVSSQQKSGKQTFKDSVGIAHYLLKAKSS